MDTNTNVKKKPSLPLIDRKSPPRDFIPKSKSKQQMETKPIQIIKIKQPD